MDRTKMNDCWDFVGRYLDRQSEAGLLRKLRPLSSIGPGARLTLDGRSFLNLASNDYLGLKSDPRLAAAAAGAAREWGVGAGSSRLVSGTTELHQELEAELARFLGCESALTFSSGFAAGTGVIAALMGRGDRVYLDRLCHACLYDGARLSGAKLRRYRHNDPAHLEGLLKKDSSRSGKALVVTESVFSMDGDRAPLAGVYSVCRRYEVLLLVDEAHAVGVLGPGGRGLAAEEGLEGGNTLIMGTFGKALGVSGAFIAAPIKVRDYLVNTCRPFIYSTAPPPLLMAAVRVSLKIILSAQDKRKRLSRMAAGLRERLRASGIDTLESTTQIIPALAGPVGRALEFSDNLMREGVYAPAIRPPTVPRGTSRVRFSLSAAITDEDFEFLLGAVERALGGRGRYT